jgi:putative component of membrane protein insertase Oxa1/YidC/SpoIIIJ protein YidD
MSASSEAHRPRAAVGAIRRGAQSVVLAPIFVYQRLISPALPRRCKYEPTCSRYAVDAF